MVEPLFISEKANRASVGDTFILDGDEGKHAATVRRIRVGESIQVTDGFGIRVRGTVNSVNSGVIHFLVSAIEHESKPQLELTLVQALAKGDRDELAIQAATELGVLAVIPWQAQRSISRWEGSKVEKSVLRWQSIVTEAMKQSLRVFNPVVQVPVSTSQLAKLVSDFDSVIILDPTAESALTAANSLAGKVAIVVGPEGGIDSSELDTLTKAGASRVHLGRGILRTSTAGLVALSIIGSKAGSFDE